MLTEQDRRDAITRYDCPLCGSFVPAGERHECEKRQRDKQDAIEKPRVGDRWRWQSGYQREVDGVDGGIISYIFNARRCYSELEEWRWMLSVGKSTLIERGRN